MLKRSIPLLLLMMSWLGPIIYLTYRVDNYTAQIEENNRAIYELMFFNNSVQYTIMDTEGRIMHYIANHSYEVVGCPECGLLSKLAIRKNEISEEMSNPDTSLEKLEDLRVEESSIDKYLFKKK